MGRELKSLLFWLSLRRWLALGPWVSDVWLSWFSYTTTHPPELEVAPDSLFPSYQGVLRRRSICCPSAHKWKGSFPGCLWRRKIQVEFLAPPWLLISWLTANNRYFRSSSQSFLWVPGSLYKSPQTDPGLPNFCGLLQIPHCLTSPHLVVTNLSMILAEVFLSGAQLNEPGSEYLHHIFPCRHWPSLDLG